LDKIEAGDSKREVICICFGHPTKKMVLVGALHGWAAMAGLESSMMGLVSSARREQMEGEEWNRRARLLAMGGGRCHEGGCVGGARSLAVGETVRCVLVLVVLLREEEKEREEREKKRTKGREKEEKELGKFFEPRKFPWRKIKDNLWSRFKIKSIKERNRLNYN
jgi:hypothetical protein